VHTLNLEPYQYIRIMLTNI